MFRPSTWEVQSNGWLVAGGAGGARGASAAQRGALRACGKVPPVPESPSDPADRCLRAKVCRGPKGKEEGGSFALFRI